MAYDYRLLDVVCAWCGKPMGRKFGKWRIDSTRTDGMCKACAKRETEKLEAVMRELGTLPPSPPSP
jgi:hypothetical protein